MKSAIIFLFGFLFGVATLIIFRREIQLQAQIHTIVLLGLLGTFLTVVILYWLSRLSKSSEMSSKATSGPSKWAQFIWSSTILVLLYFMLVLVTLEF